MSRIAQAHVARSLAPGSEIASRKGAYVHASRAGRQLPAHKLALLVQQDGARRAAIHARRQELRFA